MAAKKRRKAKFRVKAKQTFLTKVRFDKGVFARFMEDCLSYGLFKDGDKVRVTVTLVAR